MSRERLDPVHLDAAHKHCIFHRAEIEASELFGCFHCRRSGPVAEITEWTDDGDTALCPKCGIDSVLGSASGFPVANGLFLGAMKRRWF